MALKRHSFAAMPDEFDSTSTLIALAQAVQRGNASESLRLHAAMALAKVALYAHAGKDQPGHLENRIDGSSKNAS
jgi:hypothetical protein